MHAFNEQHLRNLEWIAYVIVSLRVDCVPPPFRGQSTTSRQLEAQEDQDRSDDGATIQGRGCNEAEPGPPTVTEAPSEIFWRPYQLSLNRVFVLAGRTEDETTKEPGAVVDTRRRRDV